MEINGVPLHPLVIHAAVVFGPVSGLVSLWYVASSRRARLEAVTVLLAVVASGAIGAAWYTGRQFLHSRPELKQLPLVHTHQHRANLLAISAIVYVVLALAVWLTRGQPSSRVVRVLFGLGALAVLALVVLTGDAGARAVWS